jgi:hypothetical protein
MIPFMAGLKLFFGPAISKTMFRSQVLNQYPLFFRAVNIFVWDN